MQTATFIRLTTLALAMSTPACFAVVNLDPYRVSTDPPDAGGADTGGTMPGNDASGAPETTVPLTGSFDLKLALLGMSPHITQMLEYRVIDSNNFIQLRGLINPM